MLSRLVIAFLPRSQRLLISWLLSLSVVIWEPKKIKSVTAQQDVNKVGSLLCCLKKLPRQAVASVLTDLANSCEQEGKMCMVLNVGRRECLGPVLFCGLNLIFTLESQLGMGWRSQELQALLAGPRDQESK